MREILFRGKRSDNGNWIEGHLFARINDCFIIPLPVITSKSLVDRETVGQFTGLTDKNGKKIFEGDILKWDAEEWGEEYCEPVEWDYSFFGIRQNDWQEFCEVIGNIHDNPELLKNP